LPRCAQDLEELNAEFFLHFTGKGNQKFMQAKQRIDFACFSAVQVTLDSANLNAKFDCLALTAFSSDFRAGKSSKCFVTVGLLGERGQIVEQAGNTSLG